jgi:phage baseplate assembly protein W
MSEITISLPFRLDAYGKIATTVDYSKIWQDRVLQVIATQIGERIMNNNFGTDITFEVFNSSDMAISHVKSEIQKAFTKYLQILTLSNTSVTYNDLTNQLIVEITYQLPNKKTDAVIVAVGAVSGKRPAYQENL